MNTQVSGGDAPQQHKHPMGNADDAEYDQWTARMQVRFDATLEGNRPLFRTECPQGSSLFDVYLAAFTDDVRQFHNCQACRTFINRFGGLVVIEEDGCTRSAIWNLEDVPQPYRKPVQDVLSVVLHARVLDVFYAEEARLGTPDTGIWHHLSVDLPEGHSAIYTSKVMTAGQAMASKAEDFRTVSRALAEWSPVHIKQAITMLKGELLARSEKVLPGALWLQALHAARLATARKGSNRTANVTWRAIATAPDGFCHPKAGMLGTLLNDIAAGKDFAAIARSFGAKMDPIKYQRPQAAPSAGTIAQAEKLVEQLGLAPALRRRFARIEEIDALWRPDPPKPDVLARGGVFGHIIPKGAVAVPETRLALPAITITWEKFRRTVLPEAAAMEYLTPYKGGYCALVTAAVPDAPMLFQYDLETQRNPFSVYVHHGGSLAREWKLTNNAWTKVTALTLRPEHWFGAETRYPHIGQGLVIVLEGAQETNKVGLGIFPETLRGELHGVRAVVEAHSKSGEMEGGDEASACGVLLGQRVNAAWSEALRVTDRTGAVLTYKIDRWD